MKKLLVVGLSLVNLGLGIISCGEEEPKSNLNGVVRKSPWPNGVIPFEISSDFTAEKRQQILDAMSWWERGTPIRFIQRTNQAAFAEFVVPVEDVCRSPVGYSGVRSAVEIGNRCYTGVIAHEIGHLLGLHHEHARLDRDQYVTIHKDNIVNTDYCRRNYNKATSRQYVDIGPFDTQSIMMYPSRVGGKCVIDSSKPVITFKDGSYINQRTKLSFSDRAAITNLYFPLASDANSRNQAYAGREAHDFCSRLGFSSGYLNGHQQRYANTELVFGIACVESKAGKLIDISTSELGFSANSSPSYRNRQVHDACRRKGYGSGFLNGHQANRNGQTVLGAFCLKKEAVHVASAPSDINGDGNWSTLGRFANDTCTKQGHQSGRVNGHEGSENGQRVLGIACLRSGFSERHDIWVGK